MLGSFRLNMVVLRMNEEKLSRFITDSYAYFDVDQSASPELAAAYNLRQRYNASWIIANKEDLKCYGLIISYQESYVQVGRDTQFWLNFDFLEGENE